MTAPATPATPAHDIAPDTHTTVLLLSCAGFFSGAALRICDSLLPRLAHDFDRTAGAAGLVIIGFSVAYGFSQLVFGPLGDRYGKALLVSIALFGCALGSLASALAPGFAALVGARMIWGVAAAGVIPMSMAWIGDAVPYEQRQATLARFLTGSLVGMMGGQVAGGLFGDSALGWRGAFFTLAVGYVLVAVLLMLRVRRLPPVAIVPAATRPTFGAQQRSVLRTRWARAVLAAGLAEGIFLLGPMAYLPAYLHQRFGLSLTGASALIALYAAGGLVYSVSARHIVRRFGEWRMVFAGGLLMGAGYLAWWLMPFALLAAPIALLVGFGTYLYHSTLQTHATQMVPAARGTAVTLFAFCLFAGQAIGVSLAGQAFDHIGVAPLLLVPALALPLTGWIFARALQRRGQAA